MALVLHIPKQHARVVVVVAVAAMAGAGVTARAVATEAVATPPESALASAYHAVRIDPSQQPPGQTPAAANEQAGGSPGAQDPAQQNQPPQGEPAQQGEATPPPANAQQELLTPEERTALALVEQIIRDQEGVLMGTDFSYNPAGRRDPFQSLIATGAGPGGDVPAGQRPQGLPGFLISEVEIKAIAAAQGRWHAMITGPNQRAYFLDVGTELWDGHVTDIRPGEVVFEQLVSDMTGARRTREVIKQLSTSGGGQTP